MNYFSSVKLWSPLVQGIQQQIKTMKRGLTTNSDHVVNKAPGVTPDEFRAIIAYMYGLQPPPYVLIAALLVGYLTLARQSNLILTSPVIADCPHVLKFCDFRLTPNALLVTSMKLKFASAPPPPPHSI